MHVLFSLHEPMLFRGPMEFSPFVRGPKTVARSLILPTPSTIAGALASLSLDVRRTSPRGAAGWDEEVVDVLGLDGVIKGPYLMVEGGGGLYTQFLDYLVRLDEVAEAIRSAGQDLRSSLMERRKKLKELLEGLDHRVGFYQPAFMERVGTRLERAYKRVKEEGGLYTIQMVDYSRLRSDKGEAIDGVSVATEICGRSKVSELEGREYVLRFGGEGRLSRLTIREGEPLTSKVKELLADFEEGEAYLYLITYSLYRSSKEHAKFHEVCKGAYVAPAVWKKIEEVLRRGSSSIVPRYMIGECGILGAGYSISAEARKPMYVALLPGAIIKVRGTKTDLFNLYMRGVSEVGSKIGYGTVVPIPVPR